MDITPLMLEFRAACRQMWNEHYLQSIEISDGSFELEGNFCELERLLFRAIVLYRVCGEDREEDLLSSHMAGDRRPLRNFALKPSKGQCEVRISRDRQAGSGYWDYPVARLAGEDADVALVHFFDFAYDAPREYEFFEGEVTGSHKFPDLTGRRVLMRVDDTLVHYAVTGVE